MVAYAERLRRLPVKQDLAGSTPVRDPKLSLRGGEKYMTEEKLKVPTMQIKTWEPLPPGATVLDTLSDGTRIIQYPNKFMPTTEQGQIVEWNRRPREDFK